VCDTIQAKLIKEISMRKIIKRHKIMGRNLNANKQLKLFNFDIFFGACHYLEVWVDI